MAEETLSQKMVRSVQKRYHSGMMKWHYEHGLVLYASLLAAEKYNMEGVEDWVYSLYDPLIGEDGTIATYRKGEYNLDQINAGRALFRLYDRTKEERFRIAQDVLRDQLKTQPRCLNGVYWHKEIYPWQIWLDGLYMEGPFNAEYGFRHDDEDEIEDVISQLLTTYDCLKDPQTGLLYHAFDESRGQRWSNEITGCSPHFWSRSIGWYMMALVDVLDFVAEDNPRRSSLIDRVRALSSSVLPFQDRSGMWYQVPDCQTREGNYLETSGTSMFAYTFYKGVRKGYLDPSYLTPAGKAIEGIKSLYLTQDNGEYHLGGICSVAGLGGNPYRDGSFKYYIKEKIAVDDFKGVGPFILALIESEN